MPLCRLVRSTGLTIEQRIRNSRVRVVDLFNSILLFFCQSKRTKSPVFSSIRDLAKLSPNRTFDLVTYSLIAFNTTCSQWSLQLVRQLLGVLQLSRDTSVSKKDIDWFTRQTVEYRHLSEVTQIPQSCQPN